MQATAAATLAGLMTLDASALSGGAGADGVLEGGSWHGAEAYHFWLLAHRQLYQANVDGAMRTALHLRSYEDVLAPAEVYSFLALAAFYNQYYGQCSKVGGPGKGVDGHEMRCDGTVRKRLAAWFFASVFWR
jgi:WD repeat-containing protein 35